MYRVPVQNAPGKTILVDQGATVGATIGVNLYNADGTLFDVSQLTTSTQVINGVTTTVIVDAGSNSGYSADISPATAPTNFDLDIASIAGLGSLAFPTINYILVGDGANWNAVPVTGDVTNVGGAMTVNPLVIYLTAMTFGA